MDGPRRLGWLLVAAQFVLLAVLTVPWSSLWHLPGGIVVVGWVLRGGGAVLAAVGAVHLGGALTAQPVPKPGAGVVADGVYRHTRHPIYTGLLLYGAGSVLVTGHPVVLAAAVSLLALLMAKSRWEESMLIRSTPNYRQYAQRTGRFIPWVGRLRFGRCSSSRLPTAEPNSLLASERNSSAGSCRITPRSGEPTQGVHGALQREAAPQHGVLGGLAGVAGDCFVLKCAVYFDLEVDLWRVASYEAGTELTVQRRGDGVGQAPRRTGTPRQSPAASAASVARW